MLLSNSADTEKLPEDCALASKHVGAVELNNKIVKMCICWLFVNTVYTACSQVRIALRLHVLNYDVQAVVR
jgi:hypothetical protein